VRDVRHVGRAGPLRQRGVGARVLAGVAIGVRVGDADDRARAAVENDLRFEVPDSRSKEVYGIP